MNPRNVGNCEDMPLSVEVSRPQPPAVHPAGFLKGVQQCRLRHFDARRNLTFCDQQITQLVERPADNARRKRAIRHGGPLAKVSANATGFDVAAPTEDNETLLTMNEALDRFATHDARKAELVKLKYFAGLTLEEAADTLGISHRTAKRDWAYARAWLFNEVKRLQEE